MDPKVLQILQQIAGVATAVAALNPDVVNVEATTKALVAVIAAGLPAKDDGSAYTDEELHAAAAKVEATADEIINRDGGDPGDETGQ
jgi:hypothetical protein